MIIDTLDLEIFKCKLIKFDVDTSKYNNNGAYWNMDSLLPIKGIKKETYRKLNTSFLFENSTELELEKSISIFLESVKECTFKYNTLYYDVEVSENDNSPNKLIETACILNISFKLLNMYEDEKSIITSSSDIININSPKSCYANLEIESNTNIITCTIRINDDDIVVKNIKGGETIYVGSGKVIAGGKSKMNDVDIWEFPRLNPGKNIVSIDRSDVNLTIKYCERW